MTQTAATTAAPAAPVGPPPPFLTGCIFSPPGLGKTAAVLAAFPRACCIGTREAIVTVAENVLGFTPTVWPWYYDTTNSCYVNMAKALDPTGAYQLPEEVTELDGLQRVLEALARTGWGERFGAVYVDDQTLIDKGWISGCKRQIEYDVATQNESGRHISFKDGRVVGDTRGLYGDLGDRKVSLSMISLSGRFHFMSSAHELAAGTDAQKGTSWPTGPDFGSKTHIKRVPAWYSFCARMIFDGEALDPWLKRSFYVDKDRLSYVMSKDRTGVCWSNTPASLRAVLTASNTNYKLSRPPGLERLDEYMQMVAGVVVSSGGDSTACSEVLSKVFLAETQSDHVPLECTTNPQRYARWACQEGLALGVIRLHRGAASALTGWGGIGKSGPAAPPPPPA